MKNWQKWAIGIVVVFLGFQMCSGGYPYSSIEDFKNSLDGNTYIYDGKKDHDGCWYKFVVYGDKVKAYIASPGAGEWGESRGSFDCEYVVERFEDTGVKYYATKFGIWTLACPFEESSTYEDYSSLFNKGALMLMGASSRQNFLLKKDDSDPWD